MRKIWGVAVAGLRKEIVIDCDHPAALARFWAKVLTGYAVLPHDAGERVLLAAQGLTPETDPSVMVAGPGPKLCVPRKPGERPARNRFHLDVAAEVARLLALGARLRRQTADYNVLTDPEGNNFCRVPV